MCWAAGAGAAAAGGGRAARADLAAARAARRVEWRRNVRACCTRRCETRQVEGMRGMTPCTRLQTARVATRARVCAAPSDPACLVCVKSPSMSVAVLTLRHRVVGLVPLFVTLFHAPRVDPRAVWNERAVARLLASALRCGHVISPWASQRRAERAAHPGAASGHGAHHRRTLAKRTRTHARFLVCATITR